MQLVFSDQAVVAEESLAGIITTHSDQLGFGDEYLDFLGILEPLRQFEVGQRAVVIFLLRRRLAESDVFAIASKTNPLLDLFRVLDAFCLLKTPQRLGPVFPFAPVPCGLRRAPPALLSS